MFFKEGGRDERREKVGGGGGILRVLVIHMLVTHEEFLNLQACKTF